MAASGRKHLGCVHVIKGGAYVRMCNSSNSRFLVYHSLLNTLFHPGGTPQYLRETVNVYRYVMAVALHRSLGLQCERCGVG